MIICAVAFDVLVLPVVKEPVVLELEMMAVLVEIDALVLTTGVSFF